MRLWCLFVCCLPLAAFSQEWEPREASGAYRFTTGRGHWGHAFHGVAWMEVDPRTRPYARFDYTIDRPHKWALSTVLGADQDIGTWVGRSAFGYSWGRLREADRSSQAFLLDLGLTKPFQNWSFGGEYRFSIGTMERTTSAPMVKIKTWEQARSLALRLGSSALEVVPEKFSLHEFPLFARGSLPGLPRLRTDLSILGWLRSDGGPGLSEGLDLAYRFRRHWEWTTGVSFDQSAGRRGAVFLGMGIRYVR